MIFSSKIQQAIQFAITAHSGQTRKGTNIPYITHPLSVALILVRAGAADDVVVSGILHDTVEDSDGKVTEDTLRTRFGPRVAELVMAVTERDKSLPWEVRKQQALEHIAAMDHDVLLVKSADVLHNLAEIERDVHEHGASVFERFNAPREKQLDRYAKLAAALRRAWPENPLLPEIKEHVHTLRKLT